MNEIDVNSLLERMRVLAQQSSGALAEPTETERADFGALLKASIDSVNQTQQHAKGLATDFEAGREGLDLAEVMVAVQKASVSFQAMTEVRNKLVDAYKEIMNMPV